MSRHRRKTTKYLSLAFIIAAVIIYRWWHEREKPPPAPPGVYLMSWVIDGDTGELNGEEKVRLLGIDTPERGEIFYDSARAVFSRLAKGKEVKLVFDQRRRDRYDRLLAYLFVDTTFINAEIIASGYANVYFFPDDVTNDSLISRLLDAQRSAMKRGRGIWSLPVQEEKSYIGNSKQRRFHRPDCKSTANVPARNRVDFRTRDEAFFEGYSPCRNCKP